METGNYHLKSVFGAKELKPLRAITNSREAQMNTLPDVLAAKGSGGGIIMKPIGMSGSSGNRTTGYAIGIKLFNKSSDITKTIGLLFVGERGRFTAVIGKGLLLRWPSGEKTRCGANFLHAGRVLKREGLCSTLLWKNFQNRSIHLVITAVLKSPGILGIALIVRLVTLSRMWFPVAGTATA